MSLNLTLFQIEDGLRDLYAMREETLSREMPDAAALVENGKELAVINQAIRDYIGAELRKVDGTADFILMLDRLCHEQRERKGSVERCELDQEIDRLKARRDSLRGVLAHVKDAVKFVMEGMSWREGKPKKLEGVRHSITLRGNGGAQPVEITDESLVPDEYKKITITLNAEFARSLVVSMAMEDWKDEADFETLRSAVEVGKREVSRSATAEALAKPCHMCLGTKQVTGPADANGKCNTFTCPDCGGSGTSGVPGARLAERSSSVIVK